MGLIDRLIGVELPRIAAHQFTAALGEWERSKTTRAEVIAFFGISPAEEADLDAIKAKIVPVVESFSLGALVTLTALGAAYDSTAGSKGLGFLRLEGVGIIGAEFTARYNKVAAGTLDFQLWNETDGAEICLISDATAAGDNKQNTDIKTVAALAPGLRVLRVRARSSVSSAPVYYGSSIRIKRETMWSKILEEIAVLGEKGYPTLDTVAEVKTRLGLP